MSSYFHSFKNILNICCQSLLYVNQKIVTEMNHQMADYYYHLSSTKKTGFQQTLPLEVHILKRVDTLTFSRSFVCEKTRKMRAHICFFFALFKAKFKISF